MRLISFATVLGLAFFAVMEAPAQKGKPKGEPKEKKVLGKQPAAPEITEFNGKTLEQWVELIKAKDRAVSSAAMKAVLAFPPEKGKKAVAVILTELKKHRPPAVYLDASVRAVAPNTLAMILTSLKKPDAKQIEETLDAITAMLKDNQIVIRQRAMAALALFGNHAHGAIDELVRLTGDPPTWETRFGATVALGRIAFEEKKDPSSKVLHALYVRFKDPASPVRLAAIESLANLGAPYKKSLREEFEKEAVKLIPLEPEPAVKLAAYVRLYAATTEAKALKRRCNAIAGFLDHKESPLRIQAAKFLGGLGKPALEHVPHLIKCATDKDVDVAGWCMSAVGALALSKVGAFLDSKEPSVRILAAKTLGNLGKAGAEHLPRLIKGGEDKDLDVAGWCISAVGAIAPEKVGDFLDSKKEAVRIIAAKTLGNLGKADAEDLKHLWKCATDTEHPEVAGWCIWAIGAQGKVAAPFVKHLQTVVDDKAQSPAIRQAAKEAIDRIVGRSTKDTTTTTTGSGK